MPLELKKLNLGSGYKRFPGFLNVDWDPHTGADFILDITQDKLPFEDSSVDEFKLHHILEHMTTPQIFHLFKEIYRVGVDTAILDIQVPHHRSEVFYGDITHCNFITVDNLRQFSKKYNYWHIGQWHSSSGFGIKLDIDLEIVEFDFIVDDFWKPRFKEMTFDQIQEVSRNFNNVYLETHIKLAVRKES